MHFSPRKKPITGLIFIYLTVYLYLHLFFVLYVNVVQCYVIICIINKFSNLLMNVFLY